MPPIESPLTGDQQPRLKSGRKPLQPKNSLTESEIQISKPTRIGNENKENNQHHSYHHHHQQQQQPLICSTPPASKLAELTDSSLADELTVMRKRMERLRSDAEKTEQMLKERGKALDLQMKTLEARGVAQIMLELEVDRLYRFKELHSYSMRISPVRSLRDKEQEKLSHAEVTVMEDGSSRLHGGNESPCCSSSSSNSNPTQPAAVVAQ